MLTKGTAFQLLEANLLQIQPLSLTFVQLIIKSDSFFSFH